MDINKQKPVFFTTTLNVVDGSIDEVWVKVTHYIPQIHPKTSGAMEDAEEGSPSEFEFTIVDGKGNTDKEMESFLTEKDSDRIFDEFEAYLLAKKHNLDF